METFAVVVFCGCCCGGAGDIGSVQELRSFFGKVAPKSRPA